MTTTTETTTTITHHCKECGAEIAYDAGGCSDHPGAAIISAPTPQCAPSVRLTEVSRQRSRCVDLAGAVDIRITVIVAGRIGERNYGAGGRQGGVAITLVPTSDEPGAHRPFGTALDHWLADRDGLLAELPESVQRAIVDELAAWMDDERRAVDVDISEVAS